MQNKMLTEHFSLLEFTESPTARKHRFDNTPSAEAVDNLKTLCKKVLEPLRQELGLPVIITSGYRCATLNNLIANHARRSQHLQGLAADFYVGWGAQLGRKRDKEPGSRRENLIRAFRTIILQLDFDQLILYPTFIHVSYVSSERNRHSILVSQENGRFQLANREAALSLT